MSPIFVRPVREQLEHDRLIRLLLTKYNRKFDAQANIGEERLAPIRIGPNTYYPDLVLWQGKKLAGLVEVETGESVNNLEAMAQWTHFTHARVPFHLYVPVLMIDAAKRLAAANQSHITELWTYRLVGDDYDFVRASHDGSALAAAVKLSPKAVKNEKVEPVIKAPEPVPEPKPEPKLTPKFMPKFTSKPSAKSSAKPELKPTPQTASKTASKLDPKPAPKPATKPATKSAPEPAPARPVVKAAMKPAARAAAAPAAAAPPAAPQASKMKNPPVAPVKAVRPAVKAVKPAAKVIARRPVAVKPRKSGAANRTANHNNGKKKKRK